MQIQLMVFYGEFGNHFISELATAGGSFAGLITGYCAAKLLGSCWQGVKYGYENFKCWNGFKEGKIENGPKIEEFYGNGFSGRKEWELKNFKIQKVRNKTTKINDREYSGHAIDQMQNRGLTPSVIENTIQEGALSIGKKEGHICIL